MFIAVRLETTGSLDLNLLEVVKKLSMVVTPSMTLEGSAFHSIQKVTKEDVTRINPGTNTES
jgi:hypothetical protein